MTSTLTNGRSRKSLAEQIDRLDSMLDGLSDGLNEAVATAVKEAVRAVLTEVMTNPDLLARLHATQRVAAPVEEVRHPRRMLARSWNRFRLALRWGAAQGRAGWRWLGQVCGGVRNQVTETARRFRAHSVRFLVSGGCLLLRARWLLAPILVAAALAGLTSIAAYYLGPWMAAGVSGAGSLGTALTQPATGTWLRWPWRASAE